MIKSLTIKNPYGHKVKIVLSDTEPSHGLFIKSIDGLGPAKANINTARLATTDGSYFNSSLLESRNIVIKMLFDFTSLTSVEEARLNTYKYLPIKRNVELLIETDNRKVKTVGYVESNEPDIFSSDESNQISIICPDPYLYDIKDGSVAFEGLTELFEFEFENSSLTENVLQTGELSGVIEKNVFYEGDADVGITAKLVCSGPVDDIVLTNSTTSESLTIYADRIAAFTGEPLKSGDTINLSTVRGDKRIHLRRNGARANILNCIGPDDDWIHLQKGDNLLRINSPNGIENVKFSFTYKIAYEGV